MMTVSVSQSTMAVNPSVAFWRERVRFYGLVSNMVVRSRVAKLTCYAEEHRGIDGKIISWLDNGYFAGLIYSLMV